MIRNGKISPRQTLTLWLKMNEIDTNIEIQES